LESIFKYSGKLVLKKEGYIDGVFILSRCLRILLHV